MIASHRAWLAAATLCILPCGVHAAAKSAGGDLAATATTLAPGDYSWNDDADTPAQPVSVVVSLADQRAYVYRGQTLIAVSTVSTGKEGHETPTGTFTVLQKAVTHHSNKYDDAPMPYMQRLTWDGVAIHGGANPGHPASHGCVRVPLEFAKKLFAETKLGATVTITDSSVMDTTLPLDSAPDDTAPAAPPALEPTPVVATSGAVVTMAN